MAKARPLYVANEGLDEASTGYIERVLREEHGAHGLRFLGCLVSEDVKVILPDLEVSPVGDSLHFTYKDTDKSVVASVEANDRRSIDRVLSRFALSCLGIPLENQTSRDDSNKLLEHIGNRPALEVDPSKWITDNPFMSDLCRRYPEYGNMVRFLCNERGLFLKVGSQANQRAYWNSTLNGGLPVFKKSDPIHEGTFMLHDLFHFIPTDPLLGKNEPDEAHKATYIAHRLLSEASTLVQADMVAVADADLSKQGYDISKRKIFPVYESILKANGNKKPNSDKLLAANAYFCFTGDTLGFELMGASEEVLIEYRTKYETIFRDDFLWNLQNYEAMEAELCSNPLMHEYYMWIDTNTDLPTLDEHTASVVTAEGSIDISKLLSLFRADFTSALNYRLPIDDSKRLELAYQKYLAGQRVIFARFNYSVPSDEFKERFDQVYSKLRNAQSEEEISLHGKRANQIVDQYLLELAKKDILLPHEEAMYQFAAPLYPVKFVNYEKRNKQSATKLIDDMHSFMSLNNQQLERLLEAAQA